MPGYSCHALRHLTDVNARQHTAFFLLQKRILAPNLREPYKIAANVPGFRRKTSCPAANRTTGNGLTDRLAAQDYLRSTLKKPLSPFAGATRMTVPSSSPVRGALARSVTFAGVSPEDRS